MKHELIVKVLVPMMANDSLALVCNEDRTVQTFVEISDKQLEALGDEPKKFFYACYDSETKNITLEKEAPWQGW